MNLIIQVNYFLGFSLMKKIIPNGYVIKLHNWASSSRSFRKNVQMKIKNYWCLGLSLVHQAAKDGQLTCLKWLIKYGGDLDVKYVPLRIHCSSVKSSTSLNLGVLPCFTLLLTNQISNPPSRIGSSSNTISASRLNHHRSSLFFFD